MGAKKSFIFFLLVFCFFNSCTKKIAVDEIADIKELQIRKNAKNVYLYIQQDNINYTQAYENFIDSMTLEEKISQLFIENVNGQTHFSPNEYFDDGKPVIPGGYLFFGFNLASDSKGIIKFTQSINKYCVEKGITAPFLAIDHEGGSVNRLRNINAPLESCESIAQKYTADKAYDIYEKQALQLKYLGFHMNLAPVAELCTKDNVDFLSGRSYGDEEQVVEYGSACVNAYEQNNIATVVKHFPGNTNTDPHSGLPVINLSEAEIRNDLKPFIEVLKTNPTAVLMSHAIVDSVDKGTPSCLSKTWVTDILRKEYGYKGVIFSDDIFMAALAKNGYDTKKSVIMAIEAGINCIMISGKNIKYPVSVLKEKAQEDTDFYNKIEYSFKKIIEYKIKSGLLEFVPQKDGSYILKSTSINISDADQNKKFDEARLENIKLYQE